MCANRDVPRGAVSGLFSRRDCVCCVDYFWRTEMDGVGPGVGVGVGVGVAP